MSFFTGFGVSALVYCGLSFAYPPAGKHGAFEEVDVSAGGRVLEQEAQDEDDGAGKDSDSIDKGNVTYGAVAHEELVRDV